MKISPKPYLLFNKIQHYDWGTKNEDAFIPHLLGIKPEPGLPYGELWIGAHPKAPSEIVIDDVKYPLDKVIKEHPEEVLGDYVLNKFGARLPFLLKVLSAARALSIQTHPNKEQAERLHLSDPENYPDDNHKPEIAIAIDSLTAIAGFRPINEIITNLKAHPELLLYHPDIYIDRKNAEKIISGANNDEVISIIKELYKNILLSSPEQLSQVIDKIRHRLSSKKHLSLEETQFLKQYELFGNDAGLLSFFFFNVIQLKPLQGIFTKAGVSHAYIEGNIIECMANSDNVVRAGLTNKFKDVNTLLEILNYEFIHYPIINHSQKEDCVSFKTSAAEFLVKAYKKSNSIHIIDTKNKPTITLILDGTIEVSWAVDDTNYTDVFKKGDSFFTPSTFNYFKLSIMDSAKYFVVQVP